jgi:hypothetical protein
MLEEQKHETKARKRKRAPEGDAIVVGDRVDHQLAPSFPVEGVGVVERKEGARLEHAPL